MLVFDLFINVLKDIVNLELFVYCFMILVVIVCFNFVRRLSGI